MPLVKNPQHGISLGGLSLMSGGRPVVHAAGFTTEVSADGTTWGNPAVVVSSLISELADGDVVQQTHVGNREPVLYVRLSADTHAGLVAGDSELSEVVGGPCELVWRSPDPLAPPTVIDVVHSRMDHQWDDMDSLRRQRVWVVTMSALPRPRSSGKVLTPAVTGVAPTVLDAGTVTTNWTAPGPVGAVVSVVSGAVTNTYDPDIDAGTTQGASLRRTFPSAVNTSVSKYVAIDWKTSIPVVFGFRVNGTVANLAEVRREPGAATFSRSWFKLGDTTNTLSMLDFLIVHPENAAASATLSIDQVLLANELPSTGTARQQTRTIVPGGNVSTEGTIILQHETEGLGSALVYTHPVKGGYSPPLRQWRIAGTTPVSDTFAVSGFYSFLGTPTSFFIPIDSVPTGEVHLWARAARNAVGASTFTGAARSAFQGTYFGASQTYSTVVNFGAAFTYAMLPLARFTLPVSKVGIGGYVQIDIAADAATYFDEAWLFAMDKGRLTVVECGTGTPTPGGTANRVLLNAPSAAEPFGSIMVATRADLADAYSPNVGTVLCDQVGHRFDTDGTMIFTIAAAPATAAGVSLEHYPRWRAEAGT